HDHRAEVFGYLWVLIIDGDAGIGAEDVRMTAGVVNVVELGERPMPFARRESGQFDRRPERDRGLAAQGSEPTVANVIVEPPVVERVEMDIGKGNFRRWCPVRSRRNTRLEAHLNSPSPVQR